MSKYQVACEVDGNYRLTVTYDAFTDNPVETDEGMAHHVWDYDRTDKVEPEMRDVIKQHLTANEVIDILLNKMDFTMKSWESDDDEMWMELLDANGNGVIDVEASDYFCGNVSIDDLLYYMDEDNLAAIIDHIEQVCAITYGYRGYCQGDYASGFSYMTYKEYVEGGYGNVDNWRAEAADKLKRECEYINHWKV